MQASKRSKIEFSILNHKVFIFDVDRTLLKGNGSLRFYFYLLMRGHFNLTSIFPTLYYFIRTRFLGMELKDLHHVIFEKFLKGQKLDTLKSKAEHFLQKFLKKMLNLPCLHLLKLAQEKKGLVILLSSSPSFLIEPLAKSLFVEKWSATQYKIDKEKNLCKIFQLMNGKEKAMYVEEIMNALQIHRTEMIVFTDSIQDLPLMESVGSVVAVNPDRKLRKMAKKRNWHVL